MWDGIGQLKRLDFNPGFPPLVRTPRYTCLTVLTDIVTPVATRFAPSNFSSVSLQRQHEPAPPKECAFLTNSPSQQSAKVPVDQATRPLPTFTTRIVNPNVPWRQVAWPCAHAGSYEWLSSCSNGITGTGGDSLDPFRESEPLHQTT